MTVLAHHDDIDIAYETTGDGGIPLLLILGIGQLINWHDDLLADLRTAGFHVARFDNRDQGLSTHLTDVAVPGALRLMTRPRSAAPYRLDDLADDARAVLDDLGWDRAHVLGFSHGGMIAQKLATLHPERVATLTSVSSTPSARIGRPRLSTLAKIVRIAKRPVEGPADYVRHLLDLQALTGSPGYPPDQPWLRDLAAASYERSYDQPGVQRLSAAFQGSGDRRRELSRLDLPALVIHGDADRMIQPVAGAATAAAIPAARLVTLPGLGHELPREIWPIMITELTDLAAKGTGTSAPGVEGADA